MISFDTIDDVAPVVEEALGTGCWRDRDLGWVTCPGKALHTTKDKPKDCKVFANPGGKPRLSCFHHSCAQAVADANQKLGMAMGARRAAYMTSGFSPSKEQVEAGAAKFRLLRKTWAAKDRILAQYAWPVAKVVKESPVAVAGGVTAHWEQLLGLFDDSDVVWAGDMYDSGSPGDIHNFKTKAEWLAKGSIPGPYVCPSTFKTSAWSRSAASVLNRRYLVVESDVLSKDDTAAVFRWLRDGVGLHLAAVIDTGGKSLHGWFTVPEPELEKSLRIALGALDFDDSMFRSSQVCRLPGAARDGGYQRLLYFAGPGVNRPCPPDHIVPLPGIYYDRMGKSWFIPDAAGGWFSGYDKDTTRHLKEAGYVGGQGEEGVSECDLALNRLQRENGIDYAAPLAGYLAGPHEMFGARLLVTSSPKLIEPVKGDFDTLKSYLETLFGPDQLPYFYGWLHVSLAMYYEHVWRSGQVVAFAGPVNSGKSLLQKILTEIFGGREADPTKSMTDKTIFNSALFKAEHLKVEDSAESVDIRARRHLFAFLKQIAVNQSHQCERKHAEALNLKPMWRLTVSLNEDPERLQVLPPMDTDLMDKIMLFRVNPFPFPMDESEKIALVEKMLAELPALIDYLLGWTIDPALRNARTGVKSYHDPELLRALKSVAPEQAVLEIIDDEIFTASRGTRPWTGRARELIKELTASSMSCADEAKKLLHSPAVAGKYLGRLEDQYPDRFEHKTVGNYEDWVIWPAGGKMACLSAPKVPMKVRLMNVGTKTFAGINVNHPITDQEFHDTLNRGQGG